MGFKGTSMISFLRASWQTLRRDDAREWFLPRWGLLWVAYLQFSGAAGLVRRRDFGLGKSAPFILRGSLKNGMVLRRIWSFGLSEENAQLHNTWRN